MQVTPALSERLDQGVVLHKQGRIEEAVAIYHEILSKAPDYAEALHVLGLASYHTGQYDRALGFINRALKLEPDNAQYLSNLGTVYDAKGQPKEALSAYQKAVKLQTDDAVAHFNIGVVLDTLGEVQKAIDAFTKAIELAPGFAEASFNLAEMHRKKGDTETAEVFYRKSIQADSRFAEPYINLGPILKESGRLAEAIEVEEKALKLKPNSDGAAANLYRFCQLACDWPRLAVLDPLLDRATDEALEAGALPVESPLISIYRQAYPERNLAIAGAWSRSISAKVMSPTDQLRESIPIETSKFIRDYPSSDVNYRHASGIDRDHETEVRADDRIRLGYVSANFHDHAVAHLMAELFEIHDRKRFEVFGFDYGPNDDSPIRLRLEQAFDHFVDVRELNDAEAAQKMADLEIDIAVDLMGYTGDSRPAILAHRPAPVQVNYLGYPGTMGAEFIDYILVDPFVVPAEQQPYFTEKLVHLPDCYQVNDSKRPIAPVTPLRAACGLPEEGFVFCCFNNNYKITATIFDIWMRLLQGVAGSVLWLLRDNEVAERNLRNEAQARDVEPERLIFAPRVKAPAHLARHRVADLFLDTLQYNAHTTASDALWAGLPVLTCPGRTFAGRVAGSLLRASGLPELVTNSLGDYESLALKLASNPEQLHRLRNNLAANRATAPLFDTDRFRQHIEAAYENMWRIRGIGQAPRAFVVEPLRASVVR